MAGQSVYKIISLYDRISGLKNAPKEYEDYYNDNLPYGNQLIRFHNSIDYFLFRQSSNENVVIGQSGWLFYCDSADGNPVEQSLGYWHFTDDQLQLIADNLMETKRILESFDIEFVLFIAPNKETIYMDELPDYYEADNHYTCTDQLVDYLADNTDIRVVYPKSDLLDARKKNPEQLLYCKLDTHWNNAGAYIGAKSLAGELGIEMPPPEEIRWEEFSVSGGDLANMLNITIKDGDIGYVFSDTASFELLEETDESGVIYYAPGTDSRRLFVQRDSFALAMMPSLAAQFEDSMWVHRNDFELQQVFDFNTNIFVLETAERYVGGLGKLRMSYISFSVESSEEDIKRITIKPAISEADLQYVSIYKKENESEDKETIQEGKSLTDPIVLSVPDSESGEVYIDIFADKSGNEILEEAVIYY